MPDKGGQYQLKLIGPLALFSSGGVEIELRNQRARAVLVLLALSPRMRRSRRWIESQLWSERGAEQARNSLRQVLRALRIALGEGQNLFDADRMDVWLNPGQVSVDMLEQPERIAQDIGRGTELFEGVVVPDPVFDDWAKRMRDYHGRSQTTRQGAGRGVAEQAAQYQEAAAPAGSDGGLQRAADDRSDRDGAASLPTAPQLDPSSQSQEPAAHIVVSPTGAGNHAERALAQAIGRQIAQSATESCPVDIHADATGGAALHPQSIVITPVVVDRGPEALVTFEVSQPAQGRLIWSDRMISPDGGVSLLNNDDLIGLANVASEQVVRGLASDPERGFRISDMAGVTGGDALRSHALITAGVDALFSFDSKIFPQALTYLDQADAERSGALVHAWRALLCSVRLVEREAEDPFSMRAQTMEHLRYALEGGADNPTVLGIVSQVASFLKFDDLDAYHFAERAVRINRWNPMAKLALGIAQMRRGREREGYLTCRDARRYASGLQHRHWFDMSFSLAALARGNTAEAIEAAERALAFHPNFRPPMRHLYALYLNAGEYAKAGRMLQRMRVLEPDFSLRMMREEPDYPMVTIRRTPLGVLNDLSV